MLSVTYEVPMEVPPQGLVVFIHGQAAIPSFYRLDPTPFLARSYLFAHFHQRGHGRSSGTFSLHSGASDAHAVAQRVLVEVGLKNVPVYWVAHSAACLSAVRSFVVGGPRPSGLAFVCPALSREVFRHNHRTVREEDGETGFEAWMRQLEGPEGAVDALRAFLRDPDWIYRRDRLDDSVRRALGGHRIRWASHRTDDWSAILEDWYSVIPWDSQPLRTVDVPTITIVAERDEWIPVQETRTAHSRLAARPKRFVVIDHHNHRLEGAWTEVGEIIGRFFERSVGQANLRATEDSNPSRGQCDHAKPEAG